MFRELCEVVDNRRVAPGHWVLTLRSKAIARAARPGQFVQMVCADSWDPLLPRPFSFLTASGERFSILHHVVGKGTRLLSLAKKGHKFWVVGPLGNGFSMVRSSELGDGRQRKKIILVGGGVGIPPLFHLAQQLVKKKQAAASDIYVFLGARHKSFLLCEKEFKHLKVNLRLATDDGSREHRGFVTDLLNDYLYSEPRTPNPELIYTCGPTPMLKAVSRVAQKYELPCEVSVEVPMACGFGACLGCAVKVKDRFAIACKEGPVFEASELVWD